MSSQIGSSFLKYPWFGRGGVQSSWNQVAKVYGCFLYSLHLKALLGGLQGDSCSTHLPQLVDSNQTWRFSQSLSNLWRVAQHSCQASVPEFHPAPQRPVPRQRPAPLFGARMLCGISSRWKPILFTPRNTAWLVNKLDHLRILSHTTRCNCCPRLPSLVSKGSAVAAPSAVEEALHCPGCGWAGLPSWAVWRCPAGSPDLCGRLRDEAGYRGDRSPRSRRQSIEKKIAYRVVKLLWRKKQFVTMFGL